MIVAYSTHNNSADIHTSTSLHNEDYLASWLPECDNVDGGGFFVSVVVRSIEAQSIRVGR